MVREQYTVDIRLYGDNSTDKKPDFTQETISVLCVDQWSVLEAIRSALERRELEEAKIVKIIYSGISDVLEESEF